MKKLIFIVLFGVLFLVGCNNQNKSKETKTEGTTEQVQEANDTIQETEGAIDDSGEALDDSTALIEGE